MTQLLIPVAQYLRMSTEHQQYSLENQASAIQTYAERHGFVIVKSYVDNAKSGLLLKDRLGLSGMLRDVVGQETHYKAILVLDVSRWGRFQDIGRRCRHFGKGCRLIGELGLPLLPKR